MKTRKFFVTAIVLILSFTLMSFGGGNNVQSESSEMRGIWIPYMSLTLSEGERTEQGFQRKIDDMVKRCAEYKLNTAIVQVRPFSDAIYPSQIFPYSHIITGKQGINPDFDCLKYIVEKFHEKNISVHAWVNPLRVSTGQTPAYIAENNPCKKYPTFTYKDGIYYDPSYPEVRKLIIDGIEEIVRNYDVDGVQIDDYFYPSEDLDYDKKSYDEYAKSVKSDFLPVSQSEWRKANINMLAEGIYSRVHSIKENIVFGIAPQCNFDNNEKIGADVGVWCSQRGYIDYICPQIYVSNDHPVFPFEPLADRWKATVSNNDIKLYAGLGMYKAGSDADSGTWLSSDDNIKKQIEYIRKINADGFILYSYEYLESKSTEKEVKNALSVID